MEAKWQAEGHAREQGARPRGGADWFAGRLHGRLDEVRAVRAVAKAQVRLDDGAVVPIRRGSSSALLARPRGGAVAPGGGERGPPP